MRHLRRIHGTVILSRGFFGEGSHLAVSAQCWRQTADPSAREKHGLQDDKLAKVVSPKFEV
jgi:hypothetical protein